MHRLPFADATFDTALLMHALTYTKRPGVVFREIERVLKPGGHLLAVTLEAHRHEKAVAPYDHVNLGFTPQKLERLCIGAGLAVSHCGVTAVERKAPNFSVLTLLASKS